MEPETKLVNFRHFIAKYPRQPLVANFPLGSSRNFRDIFKAFRQPSLETWSFIFEIEHLLSYFCCDFFLFRVINDNNKLKSLRRTRPIWFGCKWYQWSMKSFFIKECMKKKIHSNISWNIPDRINLRIHENNRDD